MTGWRWGSGGFFKKCHVWGALGAFRGAFWPLRGPRPTRKARAGPHGEAGAPHCPCEPRCAQAVVCFSITANSSYMAMAITPTVSSPANARPICMAEPAEISK